MSVLANFFLCWFGVVQTLILEPHFQCDWKFLDFARLHPSHVPSGQNFQVLRQIFNATKNFWILPTFILSMSWVIKDLSLPRSIVVKSVNFESSFQRDWKFLILPNFIFQKSDFWAKFSTRLLIYGFCQTSSLQVQHGQKSHFEPNFLTLLKNFLILPTFILCRCGGVKNLFWAKFSTWLVISGFCQMSSFADSEWSNSQFWAKFSTQLKFLDFAKFHSSHVLSDRNSQFFIVIEHFWILPNFILHMSRVVKNVCF